MAEVCANIGGSGRRAGCGRRAGSGSNELPKDRLDTEELELLGQLLEQLLSPVQSTPCEATVE